MSRRRVTVVCVVLLLLAGPLLVSCGGRSAAGPTVPVEGNRGALGALAGRWRGEFVGREGGRRGTITFIFERGRDSAYGWVQVRAAAPAFGCTDPVSVAVRGERPDSTRLELGGIATAGGSISGWLLPYPDFESGCPMDTWFEGRLTADTIRGMFFARPTERDTVRLGSWWAARAR